MTPRMTRLATAFLAFAASGLVLGLPKDDSFDNYIRAILDQLRLAMPNGIPELGIPVLDPFEVPHFDIPHISEGVVELTATVDNLIVKNLATFETREAHVDLTQLSLQLDLLIPLLRADAAYSLDGTILSIFPVFGSGPMYLELTDLDIKVFTALTLSEEGYIKVGLLNTDVTFTNINVHFDNLVGGGDFGEVINMVISSLGNKIWDMVKPSLLQIIDNALTGVLNDALGKCTVNEIISGGCEFKKTLEMK